MGAPIRELNFARFGLFISCTLRYLRIFALEQILRRGEPLADNVADASVIGQTAYIHFVPS